MVELKKRWVSIDAWRGYYTYTPKEKGWKTIDLSYVSGQENDKYLKTSKSFLRKHGFIADSKIAGTSNVFSANAILFIRPVDGVWTPDKKKFLKKFEEEYVSTYTSSFSIMEGTTRPIDFSEYERRLNSIAKETLGISDARARKKLEKVI